VKISIDMRTPIRVQCECTSQAVVADLEAALHWAFLEALRHGKGAKFSVCLEIMLDVEHRGGRDPPVIDQETQLPQQGKK